MTKKKTKILKRILLIVMIFLIVNLVACFFITKVIYDKQFPRLDTEINGYTNCKTTHVNFYSGQNKLAGYIFGDKSDKGLVVISPGHNSGAESYSAQITELVDYGYQVFSYDATGTVKSEGDSAVGFPQAVVDLDNALQYIEEESDLNYENLFLFGHSQGGYAVCNVLSYDHDVDAVASISAVNTAMDGVMAPVEASIGAVAYANYPMLYLYQCSIFGMDVMELSAVESINESDVPVIIIHGTKDETFDFETTSLTSHKSEITNKKVEYYNCEENGANGHTSLLYEKWEFVDNASIQQNPTPKANSELMNEVNAFFNKHSK